MEATDFQKCGVYGSMMLKRAFSVNKKSDSVIYKDPVWKDIMEGRNEEGTEITDSDYIVVSSQEEADDFEVTSS